jgi:hypothetical protein
MIGLAKIGTKYKFNLFIFSFKGGRQRERVGNGENTSYTPSKDFKICHHKNAIKHENRGPPYLIVSQTPGPTQKDL